MKRNLVKRSLAFFATAYIALTVLSPDYGLSSRSLKDEEGKKSSSTERKDILVVTMGQKDAMSVWTERLGEIDATLSLLYASYDEVIEEAFPKCEFENGLVCQTAFIPHTTWTQGRNLLAAEALRMEKRRGKEYDYWLFLDDDVDVVCYGGQERMNEVLGEGSCWQKVFNYIGGDNVPENASTIALPGGHYGFKAVSNADAMFTAFKRSHVPYVLPYPTLPEGASEWTSQAGVFCVMQACMPSSVAMIPYVGGRNGSHREYNRGLYMDEIYDVIENNYHDKEADFFPCHRENKENTFIIDQFHGSIGPFETCEELNDHIPPTDFATCEPMKKRFDNWASGVIHDLEKYEKIFLKNKQ